MSGRRGGGLHAARGAPDGETWTTAASGGVGTRRPPQERDLPPPRARAFGHDSGMVEMNEDEFRLDWLCGGQCCGDGDETRTDDGEEGKAGCSLSIFVRLAGN